MLRHYDRVINRPDVSERVKRQFRLAKEYGRLPNSYMQYYYYPEETVAEAKAAPKTRAEVILEALPSYYQHFEEQIQAEVPHLTHVRGGSLFGDMAVDVLRGLVQRDGSIYTLNVPNQRALPQFAAERIVEVPARLTACDATPLIQDAFPPELTGLLHMLAEYQASAADAIWHGDYNAIRHALAANPLVLSLNLADRLLEAITPLQKQYFRLA